MDTARPRHALDRWEELRLRLGPNPVALFLDFDGTLAPIADRPEDAALPPATRAALEGVATLCPVAVVSGRDRADVERLGGLTYAGSHGFEIGLPGGTVVQRDEARGALPELDAAERELRAALTPVAGALVERKGFALAVHYRLVAAEGVDTVKRRVQEVADRHPGLRSRSGKKLVELLPAVDWDKGKAVLWLLERLGADGAGIVPVYLGDDTTDEDAFGAVAGRGVGVLVSADPGPTRAAYYLPTPAEVCEFLRRLVRTLTRRKA